MEKMERTQEQVPVTIAAVEQMAPQQAAAYVASYLSRLIHNLQQAGDIGKALGVLLADIGGFALADRAYVCHFQGDKMRLMAQWHAPHITTFLPAEFSIDPNSEWRTKLTEGLSSTLTSEEFTNSAIGRKLAEDYGLRCLVLVPIKNVVKLVGAIGLVNPHANYLKELTDILQIVSHMLAEKLIVADSASHLAASEQDLRERTEVIRALSSVYFATWELDLVNNRILNVNDSDYAILSEGGKDHRATNVIRNLIKLYVDKESREPLWKFFALPNLALALRNNSVAIIEYKRMSDAYSRCVVVPMERNSRGQVLKAVVAFQDITEQKRKEKAEQDKLTQAYTEAKKANAAKTDFLARMSHDIRTPINGIMGLLEMSDRETHNVGTLAQYRMKMRLAASHLLSLVSDVLDMSKLESNEIALPQEPFDLKQIVAEVVGIAEMKAQGTAITVSSDTEGITAPWVRGSELHVRRVLLNLLDNAVKYNDKGKDGFAKLNCYQTEEKDGMLQCKFVIADNGKGMSEEFQQKLFEPFQQEHEDARTVYQGTGLGMAIVKQIVEKAHGSIEVVSSTGKGTTFTVVLPLRIDRSERTVEAEADNCDIRGMRILLVEDNALNMEIAQYMLETEGAVVEEAYNGQEAVAKYLANPSFTYEAVLMDIMMPIMDGYEATQRIRSAQRDDSKVIPILAMTANAFSQDVVRARQAGMDEHLAKPIDVVKLLRALAKHRIKINLAKSKWEKEQLGKILAKTDKNIR